MIKVIAIAINMTILTAVNLIMLIVIMSIVSSGFNIQSRLTNLKPCFSACVGGLLPTDVRDSISQTHCTGYAAQAAVSS